MSGRLYLVCRWEGHLMKCALCEVSNALIFFVSTGYGYPSLGSEKRWSNVIWESVTIKQRAEGVGVRCSWDLMRRIIDGMRVIARCSA